MILNELFTNLIFKVALTRELDPKAFGNSLIEGSGLQLGKFGGPGWNGFSPERIF